MSTGPQTPNGTQPPFGPGSAGTFNISQHTPGRVDEYHGYGTLRPNGTIGFDDSQGQHSHTVYQNGQIVYHRPFGSK